MPRRRECPAWPLAVLLTLLTCGSPRAADQEAADLARVIDTLGLVSGSIVAEIGAGDGSLTIALARHVGATGRVFTTELGDGNLRTLRSAIDAAHLSQVEVVEAGTRDTNLAAGCCDALVMRDVYHHFGDPAAMNASLLTSLKPGGRLAVLDFAPGSKESASPAGRSRDGHHGVGRQSVSRELTEAGFVVLSVQSLNDRRFIVVARRP